MKKVFEAISGMVFPAVVFLAVMAILAGGVLFSRIGQRMEVLEEDFSQMEDSRMVQSLCERDAPVIQCIGKKLWNAGETVSVPEVFAAVDAEGKGMEIMVLDITDEEGSCAMECYQKETGQAVFPRRGIYTFSLAAIDGERKRSTGKISILVDAR